MGFRVNADVARLTDQAGAITGFSVELRIECAECSTKFQFLGLEPGVDTQGARVSIDGLEARLAVSPEGERPSPLARLIANIAPPQSERH
jgi:hypothetical protein